MPVSKSYPRLQVEEGSNLGDRAVQHPKGRSISKAEETGIANRVETYRFSKDNKLTAKNGIPLPGVQVTDQSEVESFELTEEHY